MQSTELNRFIEAQEEAFDIALKEITNGSKRSHWMWYIFPQLKGLGRSDTATYYGITDLNEASAYLQHPVLGLRLVQITTALLNHRERTAHQIFGTPDDMKLRSSMTLFSSIPGAPHVFDEVITYFFDGQKDERTQQLLNHGH